MSDIPYGSPSDTIRVFHIDDEPNQTQLTEAFLTRESDDFEVLREHSPSSALERLETESVDCVVCDYDMPEMNGLEFLDAVREDHPNIPFILFTGKGSEEIASEAISRGVTDYLQKGGGKDRFKVLANRIQNATAQYRAEQEVEQRSRWYSRILEHSSDFVLIVNDMGEVSYVSPSIERVMGYTPEETRGEDSFNYILPEDREKATESFARTMENPNEEVTIEFRGQRKDGAIRWLEVRGRNFFDDPIINGVMVNVRDITERKQREKEVNQRNEQLNEFLNIVSHDLRSPLNVAEGQLDLARGACDSDHLDAIKGAHERMETLIDNLLQLARSGNQINEVEPVELDSLAKRSWSNVATASATIEVETDQTIAADRSRIQQLFENLFRNAVEHAGEDVAITVGGIKDGFYVADDGPGISESNREHAFDHGYSTKERGTGFGLAIVKQIVQAHGWEIDIAETDAGGVRFEITDVDTADRE